jgi:HlyD family secretion protein
VTKALAAHPKQRARLDSLQALMRSGALDFQAARETMRALYDSIGVDGRAIRGCRGGQNGGGQGGQGGQQGGGQGGAGGGAAGAPGGFAGRTRAGQTSRGIVFVQNGTAYEPRMVQLGLSNFDVVEIVSGLKEGERVALVSGAVQAQNRANMQNRMRSNSGLPGMGGGAAGGAGGAGGRGGAGGGGGGGPRGG